MTERAEGPPDRVHVIETKLYSLTAKVDELSTSVDRHFEAVDGRFEAVDGRFEAVDRRFEAVDRRFDGLEAAIIEQRQYTEFAFTQLDKKMDAGFAQLDHRFARFERKLDQFIETQIRTNELVDRRLQALERPSSP